VPWFRSFGAPMTRSPRPCLRAPIRHRVPIPPVVAYIAVRVDAVSIDLIGTGMDVGIRVVTIPFPCGEATVVRIAGNRPSGVVTLGGCFVASEIGGV
jgi:hypothetical protein